jgi:predicted acylesterase/phospholipase RssA
MSKEVDVVISGGSMDGICDAVGFLKAIVDDLGYTIRSAAGTSAGAIVLGTYAVGKSPSTLEKIVVDTPFVELIGPPRWWELRTIVKSIKRRWVNDGNKLHKYFELLVDYKTMQESHIDLHITGTDCDRGVLRDFNVNTDPGMSLATALRISCSIPGWFKPVEFDDTVWYDGSIRSHYPAELIPKSDRPLYGFLASYVNGEERPMKSRGVFDAVMRLVDNTLDANIRWSTNNSSKQPITVIHPGSGNHRWNLSAEDRSRLIENARIETLKTIRNAETAKVNTSSIVEPGDHWVAYHPLVR